LARIRDLASEAIDMAAARTRADLDRDRMFELAVSQLLILVGEAVRSLSPEHRSLLAAGPSAGIEKPRRQLREHYDRPNHDMVWRTINADLPPLVASLDSILSL